jgi:hypothetical protein
MLHSKNVQKALEIAQNLDLEIALEIKNGTLQVGKINFFNSQCISLKMIKETISEYDGTVGVYHVDSIVNGSVISQITICHAYTSKKEWVSKMNQVIE